jgi:hypothetical protein
VNNSIIGSVQENNLSVYPDRSFKLAKPSRSNGQASALEPRVQPNLGARERSLGGQGVFGRLTIPLDARRCRAKLATGVRNYSHFGGHFRPPDEPMILAGLGFSVSALRAARLNSSDTSCLLPCISVLPMPLAWKSTAHFLKSRNDKNV